MLITNYPRRLVRAVTYDPVISPKICRKRLLSEQPEKGLWKFDENFANKKCKTVSPTDESNKSANHVYVPSFFAVDIENTISSLSSDPPKSLTNINNVSSPQFTSQFRPISVQDMLAVCQQKTVLIDANEKENEQQSMFLTSAELAAYIDNNRCEIKNQRLLIIDCGSPFRYNERRIRDAFLLNINDKLSRKRLINRGFQHFLDRNQLERFNQSEILILYDDSIRSNCCSNTTNQFKLSSIMKCLFDEIKRYDPKKNLLFLQSTFNEFHQQYPTYCEIIGNGQPTDIEQPSPSPCIDIDSYGMSEVLPGLYLGNAHDAEDRALLQQNQITSIINISTNIPCYHQNDGLFDYLQLQCHDSCSENLLQYFEDTFKYMERKLSAKEGVLVHCHAGISRSPSFVIGYLMRYYAKTFDQAYAMVKQKRQIINPNLNFLTQLTRYEQTLLTFVKP